MDADAPDNETAKLCAFLDHILGEHFSGYALVAFRAGGGPDSAFHMMRTNNDSKTIIALRMLLINAAQLHTVPPDDPAANQP